MFDRYVVGLFGVLTPSSFVVTTAFILKPTCMYIHINRCNR